MCGLCHALGDAYGLPARLVTGYDTILLNLLISAQMADAPDPVMRRCPLNPLMMVRTNQTAASDFASAAAMALAYAAADDHVTDSGGRDLPALAARIALGGANQHALNTLVAFGFDAADLSRLTETQLDAESNPASDAANPTALITARLFAVTAAIADQPANAEPLSIIGAAYGAYLYLSDAYQDLAKDLRSGDFNPLKQYVDPSVGAEDCQTILRHALPLHNGERVITYAGTQWLIARLERIAATLREQLPRVTLHRDRALIVRLLTEPCAKLIAALDGRESASVCATCAKPIHAHAGHSSIPMVRIEAGGGGGKRRRKGAEPVDLTHTTTSNNQSNCCQDCADGCCNTPNNNACCCDCCHCCTCCDCTKFCDNNPNNSCCDCNCNCCDNCNPCDNCDCNCDCGN